MTSLASFLPNFKGLVQLFRVMKNFKKFESRLPDSPLRLPDLPSRGVSDSPSRRLSDSSSFLLNIQNPTLRLAESERADSPIRRFANSPSRGVVFRSRISPRIQAKKNQNGSKGSVRDLWGTNFCKIPRKSASLSCPFNCVSFFTVFRKKGTHSHLSIWK